MTQYFVSNQSSNGYALGVDTNNGTSKATPFLTWDKAAKTVAANDVVYGNPSGTTYSENSGSNYWNIPTTATFATDPTLLGVGQCVITSPAAGSRTVNVGVVCTLQNLTFDNNAQTRDFLHLQTSTGTFTFNGLLFQNSTGVSNGINCSNAAKYIVVADKCTMSTANSNSSSAIFFTTGGVMASGSSVTVTGCTVNGIASFIAATTANTMSISVGASTDGTRTTVSNGVYGIRTGLNGTNVISVLNTDFINMSNSSFYDNGAATSNTTSLTVMNCSFSGANSSTTAIDIYYSTQIGSGTIAYNQFLGSHVNIRFNNVLITNVNVHDNMVNVSGMASNADTFYFLTIGAGIAAYNNNITSDSQQHLIVMGGDGYPPGQSNTTGTTNQNLGDVAGNNYIAQTYTFTPGQAGLSYLGSIRPTLKKVGSPTGTITLSLYSNSGSSPGTSQLISNYTMSAANLTTSYQQVEFWTDARFKQVSSTAYWIVLQYTGTNDATNYVQISCNTTGTGIQTSPNGTVWASGSSNVMLYALELMNLDATQPKVYNNNFTSTSTNSIIHNVIFNTTDGGLSYNNIFNGGAILSLFKLCDGSVHTLLAYNNLCNGYNPNSTGEPMLYDKGSKNAIFYSNTAMVTNVSSNNSCIRLSCDFGAGVYNGTPSRNAIAKNNIFYCAGSTLSYCIILGASGVSDYTIINPTVNNNLYYLGGSAVFGLANLGTSGATTTYTTLSAWQSGVTQDANSIYTDPLIPGESSGVAITAKSFTPAYNSPAIGVGSAASLSLAPNDYYGTTRTSPPTIGASNPLSRTLGARSYANNRTLIN